MEDQSIRRPLNKVYTSKREVSIRKSIIENFLFTALSTLLFLLSTLDFKYNIIPLDLL